jgi:ankyrin repeat protein
MSFEVVRPLSTRVTNCLVASLLVFAPVGSSAQHDVASAGSTGESAPLNGGGTVWPPRDEARDPPLVVAALAGNLDALAALLAEGAAVEVVTGKGLTALHAAAYAGHGPLVELLLDAGAQVNRKNNPFGVTPLHMAAEENHLEIVEVLLQSGADPSATEMNGYTPATRAGWREHWDVVRVLREAGAECQPEELVGAWLYAECTKLDF